MKKQGVKKTNNNVISIEAARKKKAGPQQCFCRNPFYSANVKSRKVYCKNCGATLDPFDAFVDVANRIAKMKEIEKANEDAAKGNQT